MTYSLRPKAGSNDYDIVDPSGAAVGQIIQSSAGHTVYLFGDLEALLQPTETADGALDAFEEWAASNTTDTIPVIADGPPQ